MSDDGMGAVSDHRAKQHMQFLSAIAGGTRDAAFRHLLREALGEELSGEFLEVMYQVNIALNH